MRWASSLGVRHSSSLSDMGQQKPGCETGSSVRWASKSLRVRYGPAVALAWDEPTVGLA